jgi:hypothetical protein
MSAFSTEPVAMTTYTEAEALWQEARLAEVRRRLGGEESNPAYRAITAIWRCILAGRNSAERGGEPRKDAEREERGYMTTAEVARETRLSERTVRNHCADGSLPATKANDTAPWVISTDDAATYISRKRKH